MSKHDLISKEVKWIKKVSINQKAIPYHWIVNTFLNEMKRQYFSCPYRWPNNNFFNEVKRQLFLFFVFCSFVQLFLFFDFCSFVQLFLFIDFCSFVQLFLFFVFCSFVQLFLFFVFCSCRTTSSRRGRRPSLADFRPLSEAIDCRPKKLITGLQKFFILKK